MNGLAPTKAELIDLGWKVIWTFIQASLAGVTSTAFLSVAAWEGIVIAALTPVVVIVTGYARQKFDASDAINRGTP